jgi:hypothetical protein
MLSTFSEQIVHHRKEIGKMKNFNRSLSVMFLAGLVFFGLAFQASGQNNLTGTYQLDSSRSDNVSEIVDEAISNGNVQNRDEAKQDLEQKLESPQTLALDVRGNQISLASTISRQLTLSADGQDRSQTLSDGTTMRIRTTLRGQQLTVSSLNSDYDYTVTFNSIDNGRSLKVTRRLTTDYLRQTIFAESFYTKSDSMARLDIFNGQDDDQNNNPTNSNAGNDPIDNDNDPVNTGNRRTTGINPPSARAPRTGQYIIPNGEMITGTLENLVSTKISQNNDRFRMRVTAPNLYRGAIIEGYLSGIDRSSRNPIDKARITFNFETIRLTNGQTYDFAGFLQSITDASGREVKVDEEGSATRSQTKETAKRAGIGAGAGAIIGAIIGGAKGAIIGAGIGAGGGAGTVAIENKGDLDLDVGTSLTIQASSPVK